MFNQNLKPRFFLFLLCCCLTQLSWAQIYLRGSIQDESQKPIEFANVFITSKTDQAVVDGNISDGQGKFELKVKEAGEYTVTISFLGYTDYSKDLLVGQDVDLGLIQLETAESFLGEVVVTAERAVIEKRENKLVFNVEQSPLKTGFSGTEVLQRSPNVIIDNNGNILMRNQQARIMINGKISNLSAEDLAIYIDNLRSDEIKNIEIQSHLAANTDAEDAGGNINIILKEPPLGVDGSIRMDYTRKREGDYNTKPGINLNYGAEKWNFYGIYSFRRFTQVSPVIYGTDFIEIDRQLTDTWDWSEKRDRYALRLGFVSDFTENQSIGIEYYNKRYVFDFVNDGVIDIAEAGRRVEMGSADFSGLTEVDLNTFSFNYNWKIDTLGSTFKLFADYSREKVIADNRSESIYDEQLYENNTERNQFSLGTNFYSAQADLEKNFKGDLKMEVGARWVNIDRESVVVTDFLENEEWVRDERTNDFEYWENIIGGYVMFSKNFSEKNFVQIGARLENTQLNRLEPFSGFEVKQNYTNLFPSFYFSRELGNSNSLSFSYARKMTRPPFNFLDNYVLKINDFTFERGNPELLPEFTNKFEASFKQKSQSFSLYFNNTTDVMKSTHILEGEITYFQVINRGLENQLGLDYNRFGNLTDWWFFKGTVGVYQTRFRDYDQTEFLEAVTGYFNLASNFKIGKTVSFDISGGYTSRNISGFCDTQPIYNVDAMIQKTFFDNRLTVRLYGTDIFNSVWFRHSCNFSNFSTTVDHKEKTQTIRLWLSYNFSSTSKVDKRTIEKSKNKGRRL